MTRGCNPVWLKSGDTPTRDGVVKLLDFGLAKAREAAVSTAGTSPTMSPTLSLEMTQAGMILGTAGYIARSKRAAKQWTGGPISRRSG